MKRLAEFVEGYALALMALLWVPICVHIFVEIVVNGPTAIETVVAWASIAVHLVASVARRYFERSKK